MTTFTIDDADWNTPYLSLSEGWNMIGSDAKMDNFVDGTASVGKMRARLSICHGGTISWTTAKYSSNEITFNGTGIEVFGMSGPLQGTFRAILDHQDLVGHHTHATVDEQFSLFARTSLEMGKHNLTMVNLEEGKGLVFDYAVVQTGLNGSTSGAVASSSSPPPISSSAIPTFKHSKTDSVLSSSQSTADQASLATAQSTSSPNYSHYEVKLTPILIFVISFGSWIFLCSILGVIYFLLVRRKSKRVVNVEGEGKLGRRRTLLEALKGRRIGSPRLAEEPAMRTPRSASFSRIGKNDKSGRYQGREPVDKNEWDM